MKTKPLTFLLALTFLFLFGGSSVVFADDFQDGVDAFKRKDYKTAYKLFLPLAEQGDADAQYMLGFMYLRGDGVPQDYQEAVKWYRLSAEQGVRGARAQFHLGTFYEQGQRVPKQCDVTVGFTVIHRTPPSYDTPSDEFFGLGFK